MAVSCRVLGLQLEDAFLAHIALRVIAQGVPLSARLRHTEANMACRSFYSRNGFVQAAEDATLWAGSRGEPLRVPPHVKLRVGWPVQPVTAPTAPGTEGWVPARAPI